MAAFGTRAMVWRSIGISILQSWFFVLHHRCSARRLCTDFGRSYLVCNNGMPKARIDHTVALTLNKTGSGKKLDPLLRMSYFIDAAALPCHGSATFHNPHQLIGWYASSHTTLNTRFRFARSPTFLALAEPFVTFEVKSLFCSPNR